MHDDALGNLLAAAPRLLIPGQPLRLVHPRALPMAMRLPVSEGTLVGLIELLTEGWRIVPDAPTPPLRLPRRRGRRR